MSTQSENSLMKKNKKELVEIILRKDDVEAKLRKEKADLELDFNKAKEMIGKKDEKSMKLLIILIIRKMIKSLFLQMLINPFKKILIRDIEKKQVFIMILIV